MNVTVSYQVKGIERAHQIAVSALKNPRAQSHKLQPASVQEVVQYLISNGLESVNRDITAYCLANNMGEVRALQLGWGQL